MSFDMKAGIVVLGEVINIIRFSSYCISNDAVEFLIWNKDIS